MSLIVTPSQSDIQIALKGFLQSVLPPGVNAIAGQQNRVPEPKESDFVVFWPIMRKRIATNIDTFADCEFTASIVSGTTLVVMAVGTNNGVALRDGAQIFGSTVIPGTVIVTQLTGTTGGVGTYRVSPSQAAASQTMSGGGATYTQQTEVTFQMDVHGKDLGTSSDMAQTISTMLRDAYGVQTIQAINPNVIPLYAGDPRQVPFINAEEQYETRWTVDAILQANQTVSGAPAQFADSANITVTDVDVVPVVGGDSWSDGWDDIPGSGGFGG